MENKYYTETRSELLKFYPNKINNFLDVGCSTGEFSSQIKIKYNANVWGIELNDDAAKVAKSKVDHILIGDVNLLIDELPNDFFDCVACNDILEHLYDPWNVLKKLSPKLNHDGIIISSIPNFIFLPSLLKIVFNKEWDYQNEGTLDFTHIRFFTKKSIIKLFNSAGFEIIGIYGINSLNSYKWRIFSKITFGYFDDYLHLQFLCLAKPIK
jgi:2-polyprenyl-3-methyl-5-hydroxy-6-metoxy-1,4-benzoquinol methylase